MAKLAGSNRGRIFEPSSGGIGTKLKNARKMLSIIMLTDSDTNVSERLSTSDNRTNTAKTPAITKLTAGPANATKASPQRRNLIKL